MPGVGFDPMIPVFKRAKTVHALDRAATVIGRRAESGWLNQGWGTLRAKDKYEMHILVRKEAKIAHSGRRRIWKDNI
jgi:hypothetical protein